MRLIIDQAPLAAALKRAAGFSDPRSPIPILGHVKLDLDDTGLSLTANNATFQIEIQQPHLDGEPGTATTEADRLSDLVASLRPGEPVELSHDHANARLEVKSGRTRAKLHAADPLDFPLFAADLPPPQLRIAAAELDRVLAFTAPAMGEDTDRTALWGVWFGFEAGAVTAAACDGKKGAVCRVKTEAASEFPAMLLPRPLALKLRSLLKGDSGEIEIAISPRNACLSAADWTITTRLVDAEFPHHRRWMASRVDDPVVADKAELQAILTRIEAATDLDNQKLKERGAVCSFADRTMRVRDGKRVIEDSMPVAYEGDEPAEIGINTAHLIDLLAAIEADEIELHFTDRNSTIRLCARGEIEDGFVTTPYRV